MTRGLVLTRVENVNIGHRDLYYELIIHLSTLVFDIYSTYQLIEI